MILHIGSVVWYRWKGSTDLRPGRVLYCFKHCLTMGPNVIPHVFAFVQWYQHHPSQHDVVTRKMEAWCANLFEPFGPASFLPAQRIQSQFVAAFNSMTDEEVHYVCPIFFMNVILATLHVYSIPLQLVYTTTLPLPVKTYQHTNSCTHITSFVHTTSAHYHFQ